MMLTLAFVLLCESIPFGTGDGHWVKCGLTYVVGEECGDLSC